jgi:hypothetical protein
MFFIQHLYSGILKKRQEASFYIHWILLTPFGDRDILCVFTIRFANGYFD